MQIAGIVALGVGIAFAAPPTAPPAAEKTPTPLMHTATLHHVKGEVTAVDPNAKTLVAKAKKSEQTLDVDDNVTEKTTIREGKTPKTLGDIKSGDHVTLTYQKTGTGLVADAIYIRKPADVAVNK